MTADGVLGRLARALLLALVLVAPAAPGVAQPLSALARLAGPAVLEAVPPGLRLELALSQAVPYRARLWADPPRVALDFRRLELSGLVLPGLDSIGAIAAVRSGEAGGGWTRLVLELARPMGIQELGLVLDRSGGAARLVLVLIPVDAAEFERQRRALDPGGQGPPPPPGPEAGAIPAAPPAGARPLRVMLDPGHGGVDPGAVHGDLTEAALMLTFARELAEALRRAGGFEVALTRDEDRFVALETRIRLAREFRADVFLSLHADALEDGEAHGATIYTLADEASDAASAALAERHDRADLLGGGADLTGVGDELAMVLMDLARTETRPRTERLVQAMTGAIRGEGLRMHRRPWQQAAFSVLKAPDIPSVLIELGFLSSPRDRARLIDPEWRARMAAALVAALAHWRDEDAALGGLLRQ